MGDDPETTIGRHAEIEALGREIFESRAQFADLRADRERATKLVAEELGKRKRRGEI